MAGNAHIPIADEQALRRLARARLTQPVPQALRTLAEEAARRHGGVQGARAVLAYGSTLRDATLTETLADLYVLTGDMRQVSTNPLARLGCRLMPPNVLYLAHAVEGVSLRAKYAVLPLAQFDRWVRPHVRNPYFWARFAQPARLVWRADEAAEDAVIAAVARAVATAMVRASLLMEEEVVDWRAIWERLLSATYASELRVEKPGRARAIIEADPGWYAETVRAVFGDAEHAPVAALRQWARRAGVPGWCCVPAQGKLFSVLRLMKAAFTFQGGADYIAFKIERHTGERIALSDWQRRHPVLAGLFLLPRLWRKGIVK